MLVHLVGISKLDFTADDGKIIKGTNLFVNLADSAVEGKATAKLFINENIELPANLTPGSDLDIQFNNKGKVVSVAVPAKGFGSVPAKQ